MELSDGLEVCCPRNSALGLGSSKAGEMSEQELRARLNEILVSLCDPSLDDEARRVMLAVAKELQELIEASWPQEKSH